MSVSGVRYDCRCGSSSCGDSWKGSIWRENQHIYRYKAETDAGAYGIDISIYRISRTIYGISHQGNQALDAVPPPPALALALAPVDGQQKLGQPLAELGEQVCRHLLQLDVSVLGGVHRGGVVVVVMVAAVLAVVGGRSRGGSGGGEVAGQG